MDRQRDKICGVIVTHNISEEKIRRNVGSIISQVDTLMLIDNASTFKNRRVLSEIEKQYQNLTIIYNPKNFGIAYAMNQGANYAIREDSDWVFFLDHDTEVTHLAIRKLIRAYESLKGKHKIGLLGCLPYDIHANEYSLRKDLLGKSELVVEVLVTISSGSLIKIDIFKKEKLFFEEKFFMYYVDNDFCLRLKERGYKSFIVKDAVIYHEEGQKERRKLFKRIFFFKNYSPQANYFIFRNGILMIKLHRKMFKSHCMGIFIRIFLDVIKILLCSKHKFLDLRYSLKGILDGLKEKSFSSPYF